MSESQMLVFWGVVFGRFAVPLAIPRYPLPAIFAALLLDGLDQTLFETFTELDLGGYQSYDKALDIYYLALAYIAMFRNWRNLLAFRAGRFLWYYRLTGVALFELSGWRPLLLIFPNTFEYFFIFYEAVRLRWSPHRLTKRLIVLAAAVIWLFVKLPQEYWIHIARLDTTDFIKTQILGASLSTPWPTVLADNLWLIPVLTLLAIALVLAVRWLLERLPPADQSPDAEAEPAGEAITGHTAPRQFFSLMLLEKIVLVSLVGIIFAQILPEMQVTNLQLATGTAFAIALNSLLSQALARRTLWVAFPAMALVNLGPILLYLFLSPGFEGSVNRNNLIFFVLLLTLIVVLFDRYYPAYRRRHEARESEAAAGRPISPRPG